MLGYVWIRDIILAPPSIFFLETDFDDYGGSSEGKEHLSLHELGSFESFE